MRISGLFALVALAEMLTFFWVGSQIGFGWALAIALVTAIVGSVLVKRSGLSVIRRIRVKFDGGEIPGREMADAAAILVAGAFLISPGFITDTLGFLLLLPPVRDFAYRSVTRRFSGRVSVFTSATRARRGPEIVDVEAEELN